MLCPLCNAPLPDKADHCTRCDWVRPEPESEAPYKKRNIAALWLSLVPGLGHLYKGYLLFGGSIFFLIGPAVLALSLMLAPGTLGLTLAIPPAFLIAVMIHAYNAEDRRAHVIEQARTLDQARAATAH